LAIVQQDTWTTVGVSLYTKLDKKAKVSARQQRVYELWRPALAIKSTTNQRKEQCGLQLCRCQCHHSFSFSCLL